MIAHGKLTNRETGIMFLSAQMIDQLDRNESSTQILGSIIAQALTQLGYNDPLSYAAATTVVPKHADEFRKQYYSSSALPDKMQAVVTILKVCILVIENNDIDESILKNITESLDELENHL